MFFKHSIVLVVVAFLLIEAHASDVSQMTRREASKAHKHDKAKVEVKVKDGKHGKVKATSTAREHTNARTGHKHGKVVTKVKSTRSVAVAAAGVDAGGCSCGHFREIMGKVAFLFRTYGSKELIPDLQALAMKAVHFFLTHLSKEKPEELSRVHDFLQSTTKVTGNFVGGGTITTKTKASGSAKGGLLGALG